MTIFRRYSIEGTDNPVQFFLCSGYLSAETFTIMPGVGFPVLSAEHGNTGHDLFNYEMCPGLLLIVEIKRSYREVFYQVQSIGSLRAVSSA